MNTFSLFLVAIGAALLGAGTNLYVGIGAGIMGYGFLLFLNQNFVQSANNLVKINNNIISNKPKSMNIIE